mmetsp:Transcript_76337/g.181531  ORF Transcript_76337/g.181531 Transcript_76337/m.181531 type:complete len:632 (+) Transcript_76337:69-1964(+)
MMNYLFGGSKEKKDTVPVNSSPASLLAPPPPPAPLQQGVAGQSQPVAVQNAAPTQEPYALPDDDYLEWKRAYSACVQAPKSVDPLRQLASKPKLLNYRSPVTRRTLLEEMAWKGASANTIEEAKKLGCLPLSDEVASQVMQRALSTTQQSVAFGRSNFSAPSQVGGMAFGRKRTERAERRDLRRDQRRSLSGMESAELNSAPAAMELQQAEPVPRFASSYSNSSSAAASPAAPTLKPPPQSMSTSLWAPPPPAPASGPLLPIPASGSAATSSMPTASSSGKSRKSGYVMSCREVTKVPKSKLNAEINLEEDEDLDTEALQKSIQQVYGSSARVQIDDVQDRALPRPQCAAPASSGSVSAKRSQNVKYRVMFDREEEARQWSMPQQQSSMRERMATVLGRNSAAVDVETPVQVDTVDAVTLKLDSDSSHILCGACLMYSDLGCEKVVCYSDRRSREGAVVHSGDTKVDGKSVHTIQLVQTKIPPEIKQLYFTLCSCGPADLSGFKDPSIMLYQNSEPDANLLEYSINQAKRSLSCVMARMVRKPTWDADQNTRARIMLRRMRLSFVCIDLVMAMAADYSSWDIEALGTPEWNLSEKVCASYHIAKELIAKNVEEEKAKKGKAKESASSCFTS